MLRTVNYLSHSSQGHVELITDSKCFQNGSIIPKINDELPKAIIPVFRAAPSRFR
jgi:hypothetical protein